MQSWLLKFIAQHVFVDTCSFARKPQKAQDLKNAYRCARMPRARRTQGNNADTRITEVATLRRHHAWAVDSAVEGG
jgi:hypothetical protein